MVDAARFLLRFPSLTRRLESAASEHRRVERRTAGRIEELVVNARPHYPYLVLGPAEYLCRNVFSILFLAIYRVLGIPEDRRLHYGTITHALRGIVTSSDNILDQEAKGGVLLEIPDGGPVLPNVLLTLYFQEVWTQTVEAVSDSPRMAERIRTETLRALSSIACEESAEENAVETALEPERVLSEIHAYRGGRLLRLAFIAPRLNEPAAARAIEEAEKGVDLLGLALQIIDDLTDFAEDLSRRNHNFLRSWIVHRSPDGPIDDATLADLSASSLRRPQQTFPIATWEVMEQALRRAMAGFEQLARCGLPTSPRAARSLIELLFRLRDAWPLYRFHRSFPLAFERVGT